MIGSGVFEIDIEGKKVGFEFCMLAFYHTEEAAGKPVPVVMAEIAEKKFTAVMQYFFGGAVAYAEFRNLPRPTFAEFSRVLDAIGLVKLLEIYTDSIKVPKNGTAHNPKEEVVGMEK